MFFWYSEMEAGPCILKIMQIWILNMHVFCFIHITTFEILKFENLKFWNFKCWNLKCWCVWNFEFWNLKLRIVDILNVEMVVVVFLLFLEIVVLDHQKWIVELCCFFLNFEIIEIQKLWICNCWLFVLSGVFFLLCIFVFFYIICMTF